MATTISLQDEKTLQEAVSTGHFGSPEEALTAAIRLLQQHTGNGKSESEAILPVEEWLEEFDRITASRANRTPLNQ